MSYILEALKKAQAERQLGSAPTIHAPAPAYAVAATRASRQPLVAGIAAGAVVVALGAVFLLRQPAPALVTVPAPAAVATVAAVAVPAPAPASVASQPAALPAPPPEPVAPVEVTTPPPAKPKAPVARPQPEPSEEPVAAPAEPTRPVVMPAPAAGPDDNLGPLQSLPEAIQRDIPKVAFGGYIYSPNPAERLLLVDKMLRREGEEVAPGLVLERLLPKAAIMNFRGYRYRVAY